MSFVGKKASTRVVGMSCTFTFKEIRTYRDEGVFNERNDRAEAPKFRNSVCKEIVTKVMETL